MHKVLYKNGWLYLPKDLLDLSAHENIVIVPWMTESVVIMAEEEFQMLTEKMKDMEERTKYVMRRIFAQASLLEVEDGSYKKNRIRLPKFYQEVLKIDGKEAVLEGYFFEKKDIKGIQIQRKEP